MNMTDVKCYIDEDEVDCSRLTSEAGISIELTKDQMELIASCIKEQRHKLSGDDVFQAALIMEQLTSTHLGNFIPESKDLFAECRKADTTFQEHLEIRKWLRKNP